MRQVAQVLIGAALLGLGLTAIVLSVVPRWRGRMRWRSGPRCGLVSGLGFGAVFAGGGALPCFDKLMPDLVRGCCGLLIVGGFPLVLVGDWLDHREPRTTDGPRNAA